jgi:hypothetical protein
MANGRNKIRKGDAGRNSGGFVALPWAVQDYLAHGTKIMPIIPPHGAIEATFGFRLHFLCLFLCRQNLLYVPGLYFACRQCGGLGQATQKEGADDRATSRADKLRKRLDWEAGILNGNGSKPKGMHWATYQRLKSRHDGLVQVSLNDMGRKLGLVNKLLEG